eukprot:TRINITY_DN2950_c1_g3_i1.p1 TRINITY_DN2950_c1_g3~~TRINITY_DN2950_c1_g3_i1.p1  ORF type:complete len:270 (+),score=78.99 TRINITY_DN2950_c1_g3_i1:86-895(+)
MSGQVFREMTRATKYQQKFKLPPNFAEVLKDYTREVLRSQPEDIYQWSSQYFRDRALKEDGVDAGGAAQSNPYASQQTPDHHRIAAQLADALAEHDPGRTGRLYARLIKRVLMDSAQLRASQALYVLSNPFVELSDDGTILYGKFAGEGTVVEQLMYFQHTGYDFPAPDADAGAQVHGMTREDLKSELQSVLTAADTSGTRRMTLAEYRRALRGAPLQLTERDINLLCCEAELTGDGHVLWEQELTERVFGLLHLAQAFTQFDEEGLSH